MKAGLVVRIVLGIAVTAALVAVLALLYSKSSNVDTERKTHIEGYLKHLKQVDAEWNVDVLKSRTDLNKNYDPLVAPLPTLTELQRTLALEARALPRQDIDPALHELARVIDEKIDLVDEFKAQNAILKNSLRYAPTAVDELRAQIRGVHAAESGERAHLALLDARVQSILNDVLKYNLFPDAGSAQTIGTALDALQSSDEGYAPAIVASVRNFILHTRTILRQRAVENDVLAHLSQMPMSETIDRVGAVFERDFQIAIDESNRYRHYLLAYASVLLALLGYIGSRLARSYRIIGRVNRELIEANETLEQRVQERTEELTQALVDLKESEAQLVQSEKMASLGQMVAGVAHEINTPLAYVRSSLESIQSQYREVLRPGVDALVGLVDLMRRSDATEEQVAEQFEIAAGLVEGYAGRADDDEMDGLLTNGIYGLDEIGGIVVNLKNFSRLDRSQVTRCAIEECLNSTLTLAKPVIAGKRVRKLYGATQPIRCSASQINQVFLNLVTNAAQATGEGDGVITIVTRMRDAAHVAVDVIDNGTGIPEDVLPRIFDPFFTTKQVGKGTGLGLSIVYKIVAEHGGQISVHSKPGVGTKFTVVIPIEKSADALQVPANGPAVAMAA
jgi:two-component system, NtrC family, sensor kinase